MDELGNYGAKIIALFTDHFVQAVNIVKHSAVPLFRGCVTLIVNIPLL